jgi:hypothetical protein
MLPTASSKSPPATRPLGKNITWAAAVAHGGRPSSPRGNPAPSRSAHTQVATGGQVICLPPLFVLYGESLMKYTGAQLENEFTAHTQSVALRFQSSHSAQVAMGRKVIFLQAALLYMDHPL